MIEVFPLPRGAAPDGVGRIGGWNVSSYFGGRPNPFTGVPSWHGGMDLVCPLDTPLVAVVAGRVVQGWDSSGGGNWTTLYGDDGRRYGYGHAHRYADGVNGRHVDAGTVVAFADSTGSSTGNHLHFAMSLSAGGPWADPYDDLVAAAARGAFVGEHPTPSEPIPDPGTIGPLHPTPTPEEALAMLQFWKIKGEPALYAVGLADSLAGAHTADGQAAGPEHLVGGVYVYAFDGPPAFSLVAGIGVSAFELDPDDAGHRPLVDKLRSLPLVYQAA